MKDIKNYIVDEAQMIHISNNWNQDLVDKVSGYFNLYKSKNKYNSYEDQVDELVDKVERLVVAITNEYTRGNVCGALLKWFEDSKKTLKEQSDQDKDEFNKYYKNK